MPLVVKDRVKQFSTTTGAGPLTLGATPTGFQPFSSIGTGNTTYYAIVDNNTGAWEVGLGTYTLSGTQLARNTVLSSSNADDFVNFAAGTKEVFVTYPSEKAVYEQANGSVEIPGDLTLSSSDKATITMGNSSGVDLGSTFGELIFRDNTPQRFATKAQITGTNDGTAGFDTGGQLRFWTKPNGITTQVFQRMCITEAGRVGIGEFSPASQFHVSNASSVPVTFTITSSRQAIPSAEGVIGRYSGGAWSTGTTFVAGAAVSVLSTAAWSSTSTPSALTFATTPAGSTTFVERMRIDADGDLINNGVFYYNGRTITASITLLATSNAMSLGPVTIVDPAIVTIPDGGSWVVI